MKTLLRVLLAIVALAAVIVVGGYFAMKRGDVAYDVLEAKYASAADKFIDLPSGVRAHYRIQGKPDVVPGTRGRTTADRRYSNRILSANTVDEEGRDVAQSTPRTMEKAEIEGLVQEWFRSYSEKDFEAHNAMPDVKDWLARLPSLAEGGGVRVMRMEVLGQHAQR